MLTNRIIGAFTFRKGVYAEVEQDATFTGTAWILVIVFTFLNQLGSYATDDFSDWVIGTGIGWLTAVIAFAVAAAVINWVGRAVYNAEVTYNELVRTMGLASVWMVVGVVGAVTAFSDPLTCLLGPAMIIAWIALVVAWFVAVHEALDLGWGQTIITVILGLIPMAIIMGLTSVVLFLLELTASGFADLIGL